MRKEVIPMVFCAEMEKNIQKMTKSAEKTCFTKSFLYVFIGKRIA